MILLRYRCHRPDCRQDWECIEGDHPDPAACPECERPGQLVRRIDTESDDVE